MKALNAILGFLLFCVVLALGACLLYDGIMGSAFAGASCFLTGDSLLSRVLVGPVSRLAAGFSLVFVALSFALTALLAGRGERFISFKNAGGTVSVNVKAVRIICALRPGSQRERVRRTWLHTGAQESPGPYQVGNECA